MRNILIAILLMIMNVHAWGALSTSKDGSFQAIAQSPNSIAVYWRHKGHDAKLYQNGQIIGSFSPNPNGTFSCQLITGLKPGTCYSFTLGQNGPSVEEKTWSDVPACGRVDLLIIGATASGTAAAITAARLGMNVALVESTNRLGGMSSNGLGATDIRKVSRSNGIFDDYRERVIKFYGKGEGTSYEPRVANAIIKSMVYEYSGIYLYLKSSAVKPVMNGNRVIGAVIRDDISGRVGRIMAPMTIDATDTADFTVQSGASYFLGREARTECEPHAGVIYFDDKTQSIFPGSTGDADCKIQSYAYLMTWKDYGDADAPLIDKPRFYDPESYRYSPEWKKTWNATSGKLPHNKYEINQHPFGIDWPGINFDYPNASPERRREIEAMYKDRALGYLYFFQNERGHKNFGLADDEFLDNGNFPVSLYVREARRIAGEYILRECDVTNARQFFRANSIGIGDYPMDSHAMEMLADPKRKDKGEGEEWLAKFTPWYQIPYGVIIPRGVEGLLVTTAVSATHVGYGTLRMEPVRMSMGQAAAAVTYWSNLYQRSAKCINPAWIQDKILSQHAYVNWNSDVNRYTRHFKAINFLGARGIFQNEAFEPQKSMSREEALIVLNRMLTQEGFLRGLEKSPIPSPEQPVTRAQFAIWLVGAKMKSPDKWCLIVSNVPSYSDVPKDSPYYAAVETLKAHRITGMLFADEEMGLFRPEEPMNRADVAEAIFLAHRLNVMGYWR